MNDAPQAKENGIFKLTRSQCTRLYEDALKSRDTNALRRLCREDLFFLLTRGCMRKDMDNEWCFARCREVQTSPNGHLDLWAREHYKSSIITFGLTIFDILNDPEETFGIFSHTRPIAKSFLAQIKRELELNTFLKNLFPDVLYQDPQKESPCWSLDNGIVVRRKSNPAVATIEAWGLVDGQPTSKHFKTLIYDDVVTRESVSTPEMIQKVTDAWALSLNLGSKEGSKIRYIGTRYHQLDTYKTIIDRGSAIPRIYPATKDGKPEGEPVLMTRDALARKRADMGPYIFGAQMLLDPVADNVMGFKNDWLEFYNTLSPRAKYNYYLLCDAANEKKKMSDYTAMIVLGLGQDQNYYLVDGVRDRMNLTQRTNKLMELHRKWKPIKTGYEKYGKDSDVEHIKYVQEQQGYRFSITELGGSMSKNDRIRRLVPIFEQHRFFMPRRLLYISVDGKACDLVREIIEEEYMTFPVSAHDDALDCIARITDADIDVQYPKLDPTISPFIVKKETYDILKPSHNVLK